MIMRPELLDFSAQIDERFEGCKPEMQSWFISLLRLFV